MIDLMQKIVSLCKRRGFIFPSSEIYGGFGSCYDFWALGGGLKNNIKKACGGELTKPRKFNLMMKTFIGPVEEEASQTYLRAETCQGIYMNFENVLNSMRLKIPFGICQIGKSFRNEITPKDFIYRTREFEQMEMQWFCPPDQADKFFEYWLKERLNWYMWLGI